MTEKYGLEIYLEKCLEKQIPGRLKGVSETLENIKSGKNKSLNLEIALSIERLLERGSNDSKIMSTLRINPNTYKSYTDPKWHEKRMEGIRDYCIRNNLPINAEKGMYNYRELKQLAYQTGIDETIYRINSGKSALDINKANAIKDLLDRGNNGLEIMGVLGIEPNTYRSYTNPKWYDEQSPKARKRYIKPRKPRLSQVDMPYTKIMPVEIDWCEEDKRGIQETLRRINTGESQQSLERATEIQKYLLDGLSDKEIQKKIGMCSGSYREYVNPNIAICRQKCFPTRRQEGINSALKHLEALSHWNKDEFETGAGLSLYELNLRHGPKKEAEIPLNEYLDGLVRYRALNYKRIGGEDYYSSNIKHPFIQSLIRINYLDGSIARLDKEQFFELKDEALWKRLCNVF
jgi:hypothetical protein